MVSPDLANIYLQNTDYYESLAGHFPTDRIIYLRTTGSPARVHNTNYTSVPGNIQRIGVYFEGQF
jgi:hypothetical protein